MMTHRFVETISQLVALRLAGLWGLTVNPKCLSACLPPIRAALIELAFGLVQLSCHHSDQNVHSLNVWNNLDLFDQSSKLETKHYIRMHLVLSQFTSLINSLDTKTKGSTSCLSTIDLASFWAQSLSMQLFVTCNM